MAKMCDHCNKAQGTHFRAVGADTDRFVSSRFEWWCGACEEEANKRVEEMLAAARKRRKA